MGVYLVEKWHIFQKIAKKKELTSPFVGKESFYDSLQKITMKLLYYKFVINGKGAKYKAIFWVQDTINDYILN